jgi:hypothetical protein
MIARIQWKAGLGKLIVTHVYPPIPDRSNDWCAYYDNDVESANLYGWGSTKEAALAELAEIIAEFNESTKDLQEAIADYDKEENS